MGRQIEVSKGKRWVGRETLKDGRLNEVREAMDKLDTFPNKLTHEVHTTHK